MNHSVSLYYVNSDTKVPSGVYHIKITGVNTQFMGLVQYKYHFSQKIMIKYKDVDNCTYQVLLEIIYLCWVQVEGSTEEF